MLSSVVGIELVEEVIGIKLDEELDKELVAVKKAAASICVPSRPSHA